MAVTVYTRPACPKCIKVKEWLNAHSVIYSEQPLDEDVIDSARARNFKQAPIIEFNNMGHELTHCGYFEPALMAIKALQNKEG